MKFGEKLDVLMKITNTSNSTLARSVSLDAHLSAVCVEGYEPLQK